MRILVAMKNATLADRFYQALLWRTRPELTSKRPGPASKRPGPESRCTNVSLAHGVQVDHLWVGAIPAKLSGKALDALLHAIAERVSDEAEQHSSVKGTAQTYAFVLYAPGDYVLHQVLFKPTAAKKRAA